MAEVALRDGTEVPNHPGGQAGAGAPALTVVVTLREGQSPPLPLVPPYSHLYRANPGNNLHVSGLSHKIDTRDLEAAFAKIGRVCTAHPLSLQ